MDNARETDRLTLEALLRACLISCLSRCDAQAHFRHALRDNPEAQERYARLRDYQKEICLDWIADAPTPVLREQRIPRLVRRLWLTTFDPMLDLSGPTFDELDDLYGPPQRLQDLSPDEQDRAVEERRGLGTYHYRNFDDSGTRFYIIKPGDQRLDPVMVVYARPCVLTENLMRWLNYNNLESVREIYDWFDVPHE